MLLMDEPRLTHARVHDWTLTDPCPAHLRHYRDAVNEERALHNMKPLLVLPKAEQRCASACVLARALRAHVGRTGYIKDGKNWMLSDVLCELVRRFDNGELPELIG